VDGAMSDHSGHRVEVDVRDGVGHLVLRRGEQGNAIDLAMARALLEAARNCREANVRAVLLRGEGRCFCVGGDLREFSTVDGDGRRELLLAVTTALHDGLRTFAALDAPLIAAVHGAVAGAGVGLAAAADLTIAAADATFLLAYTGIGYSPDAGVSWSLPRLVGQKRALDLLLTNRRISAAEAADMGLVTRVVDSESLVDEAQQLTVGLAGGPTGAFGATKRLVAQGLSSDFGTQLDREARSIAAAATSPEGSEGVAAFLAKRSPRFPVTD
jgi:2-(1,2-epoxy-1,2-dihydrophenyl)acetyl-CoA isomerase